MVALKDDNETILLSRLLECQSGFAYRRICILQIKLWCGITNLKGHGVVKEGGLKTPSLKLLY